MTSHTQIPRVKLRISQVSHTHNPRQSATYVSHRSRIWMSHVTHESVMSHISISHVAHMNESCRTYEWVMSHIWMSHVTHINGSRHTQTYPGSNYATRAPSPQPALSKVPKINRHSQKSVRPWINTSTVNRHSQKSIDTLQNQFASESIPQKILNLPYILLIEQTFENWCATRMAILNSHGVATICRLLKIIGLFCKRAL